MTDPVGLCLLPGSGEWVYDTLPRRAARPGQASVVLNLNAAPSRADLLVALDQLQAGVPGCRTVALVVAWFGSATDVTRCAVHPATIYAGGTAEALVGGTWSVEPWRCSGLTQASPGLIPLSTDAAGNAAYGGTPSDCSVVRCLRELKARGLRTVFYPFLLMDAPGYPWRGRIGFGGPDVSPAATQAIAAFLGDATPDRFTPDATNLTVGYSGSPTDWTWRRMILHYAALCVLAGGVDLFLIGSEFRALEAVRGPGWIPAGTVAADGTTSWDYPFVEGLGRLADDVRATFDKAGLARDRTALHNLVAYSADWSNWMGTQHADGAGPGLGGQWPHLDQLYARASVDLVAFDDYLPLSDWIAGSGGRDATNWSAPAPVGFPADPAALDGLGLDGAPSRYDKRYLAAGIEGGQYFHWFYADGTNRGRGANPDGSAQSISLPQGDRLAQARTPYRAGQEILAPKQLRWWWNHQHRAIYDIGDGAGWQPRGAPSRWLPQSKSIAFTEYGFPSVDRCTNQPNVFHDPRSSESFTPYWSAWDAAPGDVWRPRRDDALAALAREAIVEYWTVGGHNAASPTGVPMVEPTFCCAWNWDARPFPAFPLSGIWGDGGNWSSGTWIGGKGPAAAPAAADGAPARELLPAFPMPSGLAARATWRVVHRTSVAGHVSGRETRAGRDAAPLWAVDLAWDVLGAADLAALVGFYEARRGDGAAFTIVVPAELSVGTNAFRFAEGQLEVEAFAARLAAVPAVRLVGVRI